MEADRQPERANGEDESTRLQETESGEQPSDVVLDVPNVSVDDIHLNVEELHAHVSLDAAVAENLVRLRAGVDVDLRKVELELKGVEAEAHLRIKLQNVVRIIEEALGTLRERPGLLGALRGTAPDTAQPLGSGAGQGVAAAKQSPIEPLVGGVKRQLDEIGITGRARRVQKTSKAATSKLKRGFAQVTTALPGRRGRGDVEVDGHAERSPEADAEESSIFEGLR